MKVILSQYVGFCDGVARAYEIVMGIDMEKISGTVCVLGSLVHNPEVVKKIEEKGIRKIDPEKILQAQPGEIGTLIINAHGIGPDIFEAAKAKGIDIVDTTCPKVIRVQRLAKVYADRRCKIVIVGDKEHKEVKGINGWGGGKAFIISEEEDMEKMDFDLQDKIAVLAQTTQNEEFYEKIATKIKEKYQNADIYSTTCDTTHNRQTEAKELAKNNDIMIVIGSPASANSQRLWEISKTINPKSYFIEKKRDIKTEWFSGVETIGVTAGASTPSWVIEEIMEYLTK